MVSNRDAEVRDTEVYWQCFMWKFCSLNFITINHGWNILLLRELGKWTGVSTSWKQGENRDVSITKWRPKVSYLSTFSRNHRTETILQTLKFLHEGSIFEVSKVRIWFYQTDYSLRLPQRQSILHDTRLLLIFSI